MEKVLIINFIQDVATPHNNALLKALDERRDVQLNLWYAYAKAPQYDWDEDLTNAIKQACVFGFSKISWEFIKYALTHKSEKFFIVGWANSTIRMLIPLFWILRRPYNMWFDFPDDKRSRGRLLKFSRELYYFMLRTSNAMAFCVGKVCLDYFRRRRFTESRLRNLPIFVDTTKTKQDYTNQREQVFAKYNIREDDLFLSAGSRLVYEKGFDILIDAIKLLPTKVKERTKTIIVGNGEERGKLLKRISDYGLEKNIFIEDWMEFDEFKACIANSHIFVHPARFDAYGGTIIAHSLGTPVIGSRGAGAAVDRIIDGKNGYLFNVGDSSELKSIIGRCFHRKELLVPMAFSARKTAEMWTPEIGAKVIIGALADA